MRIATNQQERDYTAYVTRLEKRIYDLQQDAQSGSADAQIKLAIFYEEDGHDADAFFWYTAAARQGNTDAQYNLAIMLEEGRGCPRDHKQAHFWYKKVADKGHTRAKESAERLEQIVQ